LSDPCSRDQTSQLPENDRVSVTLKEYLADIDVCMGGRVAEGLSKNAFRYMAYLKLTIGIFPEVYGPENVTSGASSDIMKATRTATAMVKVSFL
jgi:ATP-dependent metalloprotease